MGREPGHSGVSQRMGRAVIAPIRLYQQWISPLRPPSCRYYPSCSSYAVEAVQIHGVGKGLVLGVWRLLRCHPWTAGGVDKVPPSGQWRVAAESPSTTDRGVGVDSTVTPPISSDQE
jgi:putative membrane protein insertion efficiency factor